MCEICKMTHCHSQCPNFIPKDSKFRCDVCGYGILGGEDYITNGDKYVHYECIQGIRWLCEFLGYDVKEMDEYETY